MKLIINKNYNNEIIGRENSNYYRWCKRNWKSNSYKICIRRANIAITDLIYDDNVKAFENELNAMGIKAKAYASNAAKFEETNTVVNQIATDFGSIDILVNNAGITKDGLLLRMTEEQWDAVIAVNLKSAFNFTKAVQPIMLKQKGGSIVNMSSVVGVSGNAGQANYSASKAGLIGFTKSIAKELGSRNIRSNAIAPGFIITEMTHKLNRRTAKCMGFKNPFETWGYTGRCCKCCFIFSFRFVFICKWPGNKCLWWNEYCNKYLIRGYYESIINY